MSVLEPPPRTAAADAGLAAAKVGLGFIPFVGGSAAEALGAVVNPLIERRFDRWCAQVVEVINDLNDRVDDLEAGVQSSETFLTTFISATQAAVRDADEEKTEALRNAVGNAALADAPDAYLQAIYLRIVDELTPVHLRLLRVARDPAAWFDDHDDLVRPNLGGMGSLFTIVDSAMPDLADRRDVMELVAKELEDRNLAAIPLGTLMSANGLFASRTTDLGNGLLDFVSTPTPLHETGGQHDE